MKRMVLAAILVAFIALPGCQSATGQSESGQVATELAANLADYNINNVAILGFVNTTGDSQADEMATTMVQALYKTGKYHFATAEEFANDVKRAGMESDYSRMVEAWEKKRTVDEEILKKVLERTGYDAVIGMEITKWEEVKLQPNQEGTSDTSVGIRVAMYAADGTLLWSASRLRTDHSVSYLPSYNTRATTAGEAITTSKAAVPDPPQIEKVAVEVADEVAATLPTIKTGETGGK